MIELVHAGDRGAARAVADAGEADRRAIAATVNLLNPRLVVIGGDLSGPATSCWTRSGPRSTRIRGPAAAAVTVVAGGLGERAEVLGAASIQLTRAPEALARRLARTA